eukprot:7032302-Pyramimonas_sp.AAC.1
MTQGRAYDVRTSAASSLKTSIRTSPKLCSRINPAAAPDGLHGYTCSSSENLMSHVGLYRSPRWSSPARAANFTHLFRAFLDAAIQ